MGTITQRRDIENSWDKRRARRQAETALHWRRFANGLSVATPGARAFVRAGVWSLLLWLAILFASGLG